LDRIRKCYLEGVVSPNVPAWYLINLCSLPTHLLLLFLCLSLLLHRLDKERRWRRETYSAMLRMSTVALLALAPLAAPLLLLCSPLHRRRSPRASPSLAPPHHPAASSLRPALLDGAGTTTPTRGNRSIGRQLATEAATQGEASGPGAEALWPHLPLWLQCPDADGRGGRTEIRYCRRNVVGSPSRGMPVIVD
jgi:hypothetical protein